MNPTDTNQASEVKRNSLNKSDRDVKLELEDILDTLAEKSADSDSRLGYADAYVFAQEAKQALTSLIKELVAEAKPEVRVFDDGINDATYFQQKIVDQFEQNLLKALEEN